MGPVGDAEFVTNYETYMRYDGRSKAKTVQQLIDKSKVNICSFQGHCYCRRRPIALFDDYCGSRPPLLRIKATGC